MIIHVGKLYLPKRRKSQYAILRKLEDNSFQWFIEDKNKELPSTVKGKTVSSSIRAAKRHWRDAAFNPLHCGMRYELPERDEHGSKALFHEMIKSQEVSNGIYFEESINQQCIVNSISNEALALMKRWKMEKKI